MPYTTKVELFKDIDVKKYNCSPSCTITTDSFVDTFIERSMIRSGTNTAGGIRSKLEPRQKTYKLVSRIVYKGPRLPYKVFDFKTGKYYWARQPIVVKRLVAVRRAKKKKSKKRVYALPNKLNFQKSETYVFGPRTVNGVYNSTWFRIYSGSLWAPFVPLGTYSAIGPNPQNYQSSSITSSPFSNAITELDRELVPRFYERVRNQSVNLAQALGERRQTAQMLSDAVVRLASGVRSLKKGNLAQAASHLLPNNSKKFANDFLLYQYGVKPLLSDIDGAAKHLAIGEKVEFNITVRDKRQIPRTLIYSESTNSGIKQKTEVYTEGKVEVIYKCRLRCNAPLLRDLSRLGFTNPLNLAWELLPYSFVVDWFLPIGDYLSNMDAFSGLELVYATRTQFLEETVTFTRTIGGRDGSNYNWENAVTGFVTKKVNCSRAVLTSPPPLKPPSFKDPVSATHFANAIALLRQLKK